MHFNNFDRQSEIFTAGDITTQTKNKKDSLTLYLLISISVIASLGLYIYLKK